LNDLIPLCRECHYLTHQALKKADSINLNLWNIARRVRKSKGGKYSLKQLKKEYSYVATKNDKKKNNKKNKMKKVELIPNDDLLQEDPNLYQRLIDEEKLKITNVLKNEYEINNKYWLYN
jgi:hypothetical protein